MGAGRRLWNRAGRGGAAAVVAGIAWAALAAPAVAEAQFLPREPELAIGERYHVEIGGTMWNPSLFGVISSEQFGIAGSDIDLVEDMAFGRTRFRDLRVVLRPAKKHRWKIQYTPIEYTSETTFSRNIIFNGIVFPVSLPVQAQFGWKVLRVGYEYDFVYTKHGFVGILIEGRYTEFTAALSSPLSEEFTRATAPLPAIGLVGRGYVAPGVAINFEVSGFRLPDVDPKYQANYFDWDIHGTVNLTNNLGLQVGWRRMTVYLNVESDTGDLKFQGLWFGAAARF